MVSRCHVREDLHSPPPQIRRDISTFNNIILAALSGKGIFWASLFLAIRSFFIRIDSHHRIAFPQPGTYRIANNVVLLRLGLQLQIRIQCPEPSRNHRLKSKPIRIIASLLHIRAVPTLITISPANNTQRQHRFEALPRRHRLLRILGVYHPQGKHSETHRMHPTLLLKLALPPTEREWSDGGVRGTQPCDDQCAVLWNVNYWRKHVRTGR